MKNTLIDKKGIIEEEDVEKLISSADILISNTIRNINYELINLYWNIGKMIVVYKEENNSKYGDSVIEIFIEELHSKYGTGFNKSNIYYSIKFYKLFSKFPTSGKSKSKIFHVGKKIGNLTWSHIREILNLNDFSEIYYYINEVQNKKLTIKEIRNSIKSRAYERTIVNQRKGNIKNEIEKNLKDPVILNIKNKKRTEKELEEEIIKNISNFKKEIGNIVTFYERQYKININGLTHKVDLVFHYYEIYAGKDNIHFE